MCNLERSNTQIKGRWWFCVPYVGIQVTISNRRAYSHNPRSASWRVDWLEKYTDLYPRKACRCRNITPHVSTYMDKKNQTSKISQRQLLDLLVPK